MTPFRIEDIEMEFALMQERETQRRSGIPSHQPTNRDSNKHGQSNPAQNNPTDRQR